LVDFYLQNSPEFVFAWLGLWSIGCAPACINYNLAGDALVHCLRLSGVRFVLADDDLQCRGRIEESRAVIEETLGMKILFLGSVLKTHIATTFPPTPPDEDLRLNVPGDFPAMLIYTSGTTGMPKASAFTVARLFQRGCSPLGPFGCTPNDRWYNCMPMYHGTGAMSVIVCLIRGIPVAIGRKFSVSNFWNDIRDSDSTWFVYVGETVRYLMNAHPSPRDRDHRVRGIYGNGLRPDIWEKFRQRFGVTEIAEFFSSTEGMFSLVNHSCGPYLSGAVGHQGLISRALSRKVYVPVAIDPETGDILRDKKTGFAMRSSYDQGGEILVAVPNTNAFQGYWRNPQATDKKFARDVFRRGDLFYRTGDALRRDTDGRWFFLDRLGDTFRWKSENVSTAEVAEVLDRFPGIVEANVYGVKVPNHEGRAGCAAIQIDNSNSNSTTKEEEETFDLVAFTRYVRSKLPRYAVPVFLRVVQTSSHIHNNKQNKVPLREEGVDPSKRGTLVPGGKNDRVLYLPPGAETYRDFGEKEWEDIVAERARL
jgi:acyl-CoA synthetase (AMP-forming)/AMP-acid ligase II